MAVNLSLPPERNFGSAGVCLHGHPKLSVHDGHDWTVMRFSAGAIDAAFFVRDEDTDHMSRMFEQCAIELRTRRSIRSANQARHVVAILENAARAYEAARQLDEAEGARQEATDVQHHHT